MDMAIYRRARAAGWPARQARLVAKAEGGGLDWRTDNRGRLFVKLAREGFDITATAEADDYYENDLGTFTRDRERGAISDGRGAWYIPQEPIAEVATYYHKAGMSKSVALDAARKQVEAEMKEARGDDSYVVMLRVVVSKKGVELGSGAVGGIDISFDDVTRSTGERYLDEVLEDILPDAIAEARATLASLLEDGDTFPPDAPKDAPLSPDAQGFLSTPDELSGKVSKA